LLGFSLIFVDGGNVLWFFLNPSVDHGLRLIFLLLDDLVMSTQEELGADKHSFLHIKIMVFYKFRDSLSDVL